MAKKPETNDETPRQHKATYSKDKRSAKYNIRIVGPHANKFAGRDVPVKLSSGDEKIETLTELLWTGTDDGAVIATDEGKPVALYAFKQKPREDKLGDEIPF